MELSNLPKLPGSYNDLNPVSLGWQLCKPTKYPFILQSGERHIYMELYGWLLCKPTKYPFILQRGERHIYGVKQFAKTSWVIQ